METCSKCYAYTHDTLLRPPPFRDTFLYAAFINTKRGLRDVHSFIPDFIRATNDPQEIPGIAVRFVEAGGIRRLKFKLLMDTLDIAEIWINVKLKEIGDLDQMHFFHSGGYAPDSMEPPQSAPLLVPIPLRIRIPKRRNSIT